MDIGYKLQFKKNKNLTQEELAERTDLSKGYISQIESNHASPMETFLNLIEVLGTSASDFLKNRQMRRYFIRRTNRLFMMSMIKVIS